MDLQQVLEYRTSRANMLQRIVQRMASTRAGSWLFQRLLHRIDRPLYRWTKGRIAVPTLLASLPVVLLTTTGARTGQSRTMPLAGVPLGGNLAVLGTNYAQPHTPGWVYNLEADPKATVTYRERSVTVTARPATEDEAESVWDTAALIYSGFARYRRRIHNRQVRVFVLEPVADTQSP